MNLRIIYDNEVYTQKMGLRSDWGFSCLIETSEKNILFDTGAKGDILLSNMKLLDIDPGTISTIVISHEHYDHNGGLEHILPFLKHASIYRLKKQTNTGTLSYISPEKPEKIYETIWTTGRLPGKVDEQSLIIKGDNGWYVLTGCSHPGIKTILAAARQIGNIVGLIGGFHGFTTYSLLQNIDYICPCHCTARKKEINEAFPENTEECGVGKTISLS